MAVLFLKRDFEMIPQIFLLRVSESYLQAFASEGPQRETACNPSNVRAMPSPAVKVCLVFFMFISSLSSY